MLEFFISPILRAPTIGSMLMCLSAGLIGSLVFLERRSLVGEALSHAAYPGVVMSLIGAAFFFPFTESIVAISVLIGAFLTAFLGLFAIDRLEKKWQISSDAALCFVLSIFFGIGVLIASRIQVTHAIWYRQIQSYLFGQAATMVDSHIFLYGGLALFVVAAFILLYRYLEMLHFDRNFSRSVGMKVGNIQAILHFLLVFAIVISMRCVGVVLMSAMLIAPSAAARQWTSRFDHFLALSGLIGMACGFLGNVLSVKIGGSQLTLPTGPMIVLSGTVFCIFSLLFAPKKGTVPRILRMAQFKWRCKQENLLKALCKNTPLPRNPLLFLSMKAKGWVEGRALTKAGVLEAESLIRLHRLWEAYLVHMGQSSDRVHHSAEEMEHILTPEIEDELNQLLGSPTQDPHAQPIPKGRRL